MTAPPDPQALLRRCGAVRAETLRRTAPRLPEDCQVQSMADASPAEWHLAHTTWFFETFVLERFDPGFRPVDPAFRVLYNSDHQAVGPQHPRPQRGLVTRPDLATVQAWRRAADERVLALAERLADPEAAALLTLGLHHEQQHQELVVTDAKHLPWHNPLGVACAPGDPPHAPAAPAARWCAFEGGRQEIGHHADQDGRFAFDNEGPRQRVFLAPFVLCDRLVGQGEVADTAWQWTGSAYRPYPGYRPPAGAVGEYNGKFMAQQFVLRGGSLATPEGHARLSYRNFFPPEAQWQFSGLRLARDA